MSTSTTVTGTGDEACPGCGDTTGMQPTPGISPTVKAWSCAACRTSWAIAVVNPRPFLDHLIGGTRGDAVGIAGNHHAGRSGACAYR